RDGRFAQDAPDDGGREIRGARHHLSMAWLARVVVGCQRGHRRRRRRAARDARRETAPARTERCERGRARDVDRPWKRPRAHARPLSTRLVLAPPKANALTSAVRTVRPIARPRTWGRAQAASGSRK